MGKAIEEARSWAGRVLVSGRPEGAIELLKALKRPANEHHFERNGVRVQLVENALLVMELDQDVKPAAWVTTKYTEFAGDVPEFDRDLCYVEEVRFHAVRFAELCQDELGYHEEYFGSRRERIAAARQQEAVSCPS